MKNDWKEFLKYTNKKARKVWAHSKKILIAPFTAKGFKKIPYYFVLVTAAVGASLILGLLSFVGMMSLTLTPIFLLGIFSAILAVAYEGEIYSKNIITALDRVNIPKFLRHALAKELLLETLLASDPHRPYPQFFKDYKASIEKLKFLADEIASAYAALVKARKKRAPTKELKHVIKDLKKQKRAVAMQLQVMEKYFTEKAFSNKLPDKNNPYQTELAIWFAQENRGEILDNLYMERRSQLFWTVGFALTTGGFMAWGTIFMLSSTMTMLSTFAGVSATTAATLVTLAAAPYFLIPLALIAGIAWGFLVYSSVSDLIINRTLTKLLSDIRTFFATHGELLLFVAGCIFLPIFVIPGAIIAAITWNVLASQNTAKRFKEGSFKKKVYEWLDKRFTGQLSAKSLLTFLFGIISLGLTVTLGVFIAATFFTIGTEPATILEALKGTFQYTAAILMAIAVGLSEMLFAFQNIHHSVEELRKGAHIKPHFFRRFAKKMAHDWKKLCEEENWLQMINPARLLIKLTLTPIRIVLFLGHLLSIGVTGDQVYGVPTWVTAFIQSLMELGIDLDYFAGFLFHQHDNSTEELMRARLRTGQSHEHGDDDIPTRLLKLIYLIPYGIAILWDYLASHIGYVAGIVFCVENLKPTITLVEAYRRQTGADAHHHCHHHKKEEKNEEELELLPGDNNKEVEGVSSAWFYEGVRYRIEHFQQKHDLGNKKSEALDIFKTKLSTLQEKDVDKETRDSAINQEAKKKVYARQRFFSLEESTRTEAFVANLAKGFSGG